MHGFKHIRSKRDEIKPTSSTSKRGGRCVKEFVPNIS